MRRTWEHVSHDRKDEETVERNPLRHGLLNQVVWWKPNNGASFCPKFRPHSQARGTSRTELAGVLGSLYER